MTTKKIRLTAGIACVAACVVLALVVCAYALSNVHSATSGNAEGAQVKCTTSTSSLHVNDTFTVDITVDEDGIAAMSGVLEYDDSVFTLESIESGLGLAGSDLSFVGTPEIGLFSFYANSAQTDGGVVVATATFTCLKAADSSTIGVSDIVACSATGDETDVKVGDPINVSVSESPHADLAPVTVYGRSLILEGKIGVNVYFKVPDEVRAVDGAYVRVTNPSGEEVANLPLAQAPTTIIGTSEGNITLCSFAAYVPAKDMTEELTYRFYFGDGTLLNMAGPDGVTDITAQGFTTTVGGYYDNAPEGVKPLVAAMLYYGACSQVCFGDSKALASDNLSEEVLDALTTQASLATSDSLSAYAPVISATEGSGVSAYGASLTLDSATNINAYFQVDDDTPSNYTFFIDGAEVTPVKNGPCWEVTKDNIVAKGLDTPHVFTVVRNSDGITCCTLTYSALSYAYQVLSHESSSEALRDTVRALTVYNAYANEYFES